MEKITRVISKILGISTEKERKFSAYWFIILTTVLELNWLRHSYHSGDYSLLIEVIGLNLSFIAVCLGIEKFSTNSNNTDKNEKVN